jgi:hypothetical protein
MAPQEVAGLQALAKHHGGSLSINPETGLPEAGFLSSILPMVIGAGMTYFSGGAINPMMAAGILGGGTALASGSLEKGLMAGLGAYGGAGLATGLSAAAAPIAGTTTAAVPTAGVDLASLGIESTAPQVAGISTAPQVAGISTAGTTAGTTLADIGIPSAATVPAPYTPATQFFTPTTTPAPTLSRSLEGLGNITDNSKAFMDFAKQNKLELGAAGISALGAMQPEPFEKIESDTGLIRPYEYNRTKIPTAFQDTPGEPMSSKERRYFTNSYTPLQPYAAPGKEYGKDGILSNMPGIGEPRYMANGGPVEAMSNANAIGANTGFPQSDFRTGAYATPYQQPISRNVVSGAQDAGVDPYTGQVQFAKGGLSDLGGYSDGGQLLRGSGDGVSDSIPASIGDKQPARLADGEFVLPSRIVSEIGNGSTDAGARKLYAMMARIQKNRSKTVGKGKVAVNSRSDKMLPA